MWVELIPVFIAIAGGGGALTAWITSRTTRKIESAKDLAAETTLLMSSAFQMIATLQAELTRKDQELQRRDDIIVELTRQGRQGKR